MRRALAHYTCAIRPHQPPRQPQSSTSGAASRFDNRGRRRPGLRNRRLNFRPVSWFLLEDKTTTCLYDLPVMWRLYDIVSKTRSLRFYLFPMGGILTYYSEEFWVTVSIPESINANERERTRAYDGGTVCIFIRQGLVHDQFTLVCWSYCTWNTILFISILQYLFLLHCV